MMRMSIIPNSAMTCSGCNRHGHNSRVAKYILIISFKKINFLHYFFYFLKTKYYFKFIKKSF